MKTLLPASGFALLAGFALFSTGCVAQYESTASATSYSGTTLPAAGTVALVMEFRGGEPTPQERAEVRAILADYFSQQGTVLVEDTYAADYLVHAVMERRNPENSAEWTVVETYSANSLRSAGSDEFRWPGGMVEDDYYAPTTYSYVGFGVFYPVFFDLWSSPWHRGHVVLYPPQRRHHDWDNDRGRDEHRWHRPDRWQPDRHPEWSRNQPDRRRDDRDRRNDNNRKDDNRRGSDQPDLNQHDGNRPGPDHRDPSRHDNDRRDGDRRPENDQRPPSNHGRTPSVDTPRLNPSGGVQRPDHNPPPATVGRPPNGGEHRPDQVRPPQPDHRRPEAPVNPPPHVTPPPRPQPRPITPPPEVRNDQSRRGSNTVPDHGPMVSRPPAPVNPLPPPPQRVQPADRRAGSPNQLQPGNPEHRRPITPADNPPQVRQEHREPPPPRHVEPPREVQRERAIERKLPPPPERKEPAPDRRPPPKDQDKDDSDQDHPRH